MSENDELKGEIDKIKNFAEKFDSPYKEIIFEKLLEKELIELKSFKYPKEVHAEDIESKIAELCKCAKVSKESLLKLFYFEDEKLKPIFDIKRNTAKEKQIDSTLAILCVRYYLLGKNSISSIELRGMLKDLGISSLTNMATNLSEAKGLIIGEGVPGSQNFIYKITQPGIKRGLEIIRGLSNDDE